MHLAPDWKADLPLIFLAWQTLVPMFNEVAVSYYEPPSTSLEV